MTVRLGTLVLLAVTTTLAQGHKDLDEANTPHRSAAILEMGTVELVGVLKSDSSTDFQKAKACQRLGVVGDKSAVPALAALLTNGTLSHYARTGLETLPGDEADTALRAAVPKLEGDLLIGVINSIGRRRDPKAIDVLAPLRDHDELGVAQAADAAIARIRRP